MWIPSPLDKKLRAAVLREAEAAVAARAPVPGLRLRSLDDALIARVAALPPDPLDALRAETSATRAEANTLVADVQRLTAELVALRKAATEARSEAKAAEAASAAVVARTADLAARLAAIQPKET